MIKMQGRLLYILIFTLLSFISAAQPGHDVETTQPKPYKILSSGKQITIRSTKNIKHVMLWTMGGNRVAEHKEINDNSYILNITVPHKTFFLMIAMDGGKVFTEKIGLR